VAPWVTRKERASHERSTIITPEKAESYVEAIEGIQREGEKPMSGAPFARTVCACADCRDCCKRQPGALAPGDFEAIAEHLGETTIAAKTHFWASPGALVMDTKTGRQFRVGTITPRYDRRRGRCVFLDDKDRCRIHPVAPAGCRLFDTHLGLAEAMPRSIWLARSHMGADYQQLRSELPFATHYKPWRT
jgi:Fe-S-cluster containining protein